MKILLNLFLLSGFAWSQIINTINFDRFTHYDKDDWITYGYSNNITSIDIGITKIYVGTTAGGILQFDAYSNEWLTPLTTSDGLSSNHITTVVFDHSTNEIYARTKNGVEIYNDAFEYWQRSEDEMPARKKPDFELKNNQFPAFYRPGFDEWPTLFPTRNYSLMLDGKLFDPNNEQYIIKDRVVDNWDRLWIGTDGTGVGIANLNSLELNFVKQSIPAIHPKDVFVSEDDIWIGGDPYILKERGITHWDYESNEWTYYKSGLNYNIFSDNISVIEKNGRNVFFGTEQGLLSYNTKSNTWKSWQNFLPIKNDAINDLCSIDSILYVATDNGIFGLNVKAGFAEQIGKRFINQTEVNSLAKSKSNLFIATNYGIFSYSTKDKQTTLLNSKAAISDNFIEAISADSKTLWFAGQNGIGYYEIGTDKWQSFPALKFALKYKINHIALTKNHAWFATDGGLLKYDQERDTWYLYTKKDGLTDNRVSRIETDGDYLWLATQGGVTMFLWHKEGRLE